MRYIHATERQFSPITARGMTYDYCLRRWFTDVKHNKEKRKQVVLDRLNDFYSHFERYYHDYTSILSPNLSRRT